jgi:hypothetical protein
VNCVRKRCTVQDLGDARTAHARPPTVPSAPLASTPRSTSWQLAQGHLASTHWRGPRRRHRSTTPRLRRHRQLHVPAMRRHEPRSRVKVRRGTVWWQGPESQRPETSRRKTRRAETWRPGSPGTASHVPPSRGKVKPGQGKVNQVKPSQVKPSPVEPNPHQVESSKLPRDTARRVVTHARRCVGCMPLARP